MSQPKSRACPNCGSFLFPIDKVCPTCGTEITENNPAITSSAPFYQSHKNLVRSWLFFIAGFIFGIFAAEEFILEDDAWILGITEGSSYGFPIVLAAVSVISVGIGVYLLIRYKKRISGTYSMENDANGK